MVYFILLLPNLSVFLGEIYHKGTQGVDGSNDMFVVPLLHCEKNPTVLPACAFRRKSDKADEQFNHSLWPVTSPPPLTHRTAPHPPPPLPQFLFLQGIIANLRQVSRAKQNVEKKKLLEQQRQQHGGGGELGDSSQQQQQQAMASFGKGSGGSAGGGSGKRRKIAGVATTAAAAAAAGAVTVANCSHETDRQVGICVRRPAETLLHSAAHVSNRDILRAEKL